MPRMLLSVLLVALLPMMALAHAIGVEVKLKGDIISVEAFYDDDTPAEEAKVTVTDEAGQTVASGVANDKGVWTFPTPKPGKYLVLVDGGAGHAKKVNFTVPEKGESKTISEGPTREEVTSPWFKLVLSVVGVGLIGLAVVGYRLLRSGKS